MSIRFSKKNSIIHYKRGMTNDDAIAVLQKRVEKRKKELAKRKWIFDEYNSLLAKQKVDLDWIDTLEKRLVILGGEKNVD